MRIREIMATNVQTVAPTASVADARELMKRKRIHHLVVVDSARVRGIVSAQDLGVSAIDASGPVADVMTTGVVTIAPDAPVRKIANIMRGRTIGCVPVLDDARLVGIVTTSDLLKLLGGGIDRPAKSSRRDDHHRVAHRKRSANTGVW